MGYIYRFKNKNNEIIYIGQTTQDDLNYRFWQHSHLSKECYKEIANIDYIEFTNYRNNYYGYDIEFAEKYFICKYKPKYNTIYKRMDNNYINNKLDKIYWKQFKDGDPYIKWMPQKTQSKIVIAEMEERNIEYKNEIINEICDKFGNINYNNYKADKRYAYVIHGINITYSPSTSLYCLNNGKIQNIKIRKNDFENNKFSGGDIIYCEKFSYEPSKKLINNEWIEDNSQMVWWLKKWHLVDNNFINNIN